LTQILGTTTKAVCLTTVWNHPICAASIRLSTIRISGAHPAMGGMALPLVGGMAGGLLLGDMLDNNFNGGGAALVG
jgi:predicted lipid-binding transport protein (Tim44 family)